MDVLAKAHDASALTPQGEQLRLQLDTIWEEARGRGGELSPLGARQHRGIGHRMAEHYPAIFADTEVPAELSQSYADYFVSPMAANIQFIFFRPAKGKKGDILVRVLHNERAAGLPVADTGEKGLYRWDDLRTYLTSLL